LIEIVTKPGVSKG